jgi:putative heme-binding domain-containing protein
MLLATVAMTRQAVAQEAQWIWATATPKEQVPPGTTCYFRKSFQIQQPESGTISIAADDDYELFVNGRRVAAGRAASQFTEQDITKQLVEGRNVIAIAVTNTRGNTAALAARVQVLPTDGNWTSLSTDRSWRATTTKASMWTTIVFNDRRWEAAQEFGRLGDTVPWDRSEDVVTTQEHQRSERFQIQPGFAVQRILDDQRTGSLIAITFNEFGHIIASREGGGLLLIYDRNRDGIPEEVRDYCPEVRNCQGILALNGEVYVTGDGPSGLALYRLADTDRNGTLEKVTALIKFKGTHQEHGPHGIVLGPDGMIYVMVGNHAAVANGYADSSPYRESYEGDLVQPRYEDPGGHAAGIRAPGGIVIRTDPNGQNVELVAGGLRNAYDLAFLPDGGLFTHDSDMEADIGTPWHRSTAVFEISEGGEYGWRSGWSTWPDYYFDRLPPLMDTGRGSPTGATVYEHFAFPAKFHGSLFLADWSEGRILVVNPRPSGAGYTADKEVFLQGQPLNVTDLAVGPDGGLYFCTGGRGTAGGVYRVVWQGEIPERVKNLGSGIAAAIRQPQLEAAWSRQQLAALKQQIGTPWGELVAGVAYSDDNPPHYRLRALDLMQLFGPAPSPELLMELSQTGNEAVRAKVARLMGLHPAPENRKRLVELLGDQDARVQRAACEALNRCGEEVPIDDIMPLLASPDRQLSFAGRRLLERQAPNRWQQRVLSSKNPRVNLVGGLALINAQPDDTTALAILERTSQLLTGFLSDADFLDLLRLQQVTLHRSQLPIADLGKLRDQLAEEFPSGEARLTRELMRLCTALQADSVVPRALQMLSQDQPMEERMLVGMHLRFFERNWTASERFELLRFYELAAQSTGGSSFPLYLMHATRDFAKNLNEDEIRLVIREGTRWPNAALAALYRLPPQVDSSLAADLRALDEAINDPQHIDDVYKRLRTGITALLSMAQDNESQEYLRKIWRDNPERREPIAMGLALHPDGENWDYLVRSLHLLDGAAADDVLNQLSTVEVGTDDPEAIRQVILIGLRVVESGGRPAAALKLLEHWTGEQLPPKDGESPIAPWQTWYSKSYPDAPPAALPGEDGGKWDLDQLVQYIDSDEGRAGDPLHGAEVFRSAQCATCHRFGGQGTQVGPDLTNLAKRFTRRETLESLLYPSHVISDQYRSKRVLTLDGKIHVGLVSQQGDRFEIRDSKNEITVLSEPDIDQILPSATSVMPSGLLDNLTLKDISDLLTYLGVLPALEVAQAPESEPKR